MSVNAALIRRKSKGNDGAFLYELQNSYELSPKVSEQILYSAKEWLLQDGQLNEGQIEVTLIEWEERSGKPIEGMEKRRVRLTLDAGIEDLETLREHGRRILRQNRIQRLCEEAIEQRGILSQEDLARHLGCSVRTIKRDIKEIKFRGAEAITRGVLHNIGRGQTHKVQIIQMYLEGHTYSEIRRKTHHSTGAIKRYLESFVKVLLAQRRRIYQGRAISQVTGLSEYVVSQYQQIIRESKKDKIKRDGIEDIIGQHLNDGGLKKRQSSYGGKAAVSMGGFE
jgi:DNA-directed RNA polymerase specialized sigma24 family protein